MITSKSQNILDFWFIESLPEELFRKKHSFDKKIREKFFNDYQKAIINEYDDWQDDPKSCLALVILLDQFSRNLFRNDKKAFEQDHKCRLIVNEIIDRGDLEKLNFHEKLFMLLPLIHSEEISDHIYAHNLSNLHLKNHPQVDLIKISWKDHTDVIKKFKRYPHRNKVLDRQSTPEEIKFLTQTNSSW
ncbi:DUF924 family protein [Candidatus Pelagibacter sp. Uisw_092]|uniref:DUF924 family protein n=1 Tax=Candidatus Pelagibacter sp. Uisw_092 TaxID=3230979 RepID=UPI0039EC5382